MEDRLDRIERRLDALTAAMRLPPTTVEPSPSNDDEVLWALDGVMGRHPEGAVVYTGHGGFAAGPVRWQMGATVDGLMDLDWGAVAPSIGALGSPVRLQLLHAILAGAETTAELGEGLGTTGQLYHHLGQLVAHGWLVVASRGRYRIPAERVVPLLVIITAARGTA